MDSKQLRYFLALSRYGNMTKAAKKLFISQQAFSKSITKLEKELGISLFDRTPQGLVLTEYGKCLLPYARKAVRSIDAGKEALIELKKSQDKTVSFGYTTGSFNALSRLSPSIIFEWQKTQSNTSVLIEEQGPDVLFQLILEEEIDAAYVVFPPHKQYEGVVCDVIAEEPLCLLVNNDNSLAKKKVLSFDDIRDEEILLWKTDPIPEEEALYAYKASSYKPKVKYYDGSFGQCIERVRMGEGIALAGKGFFLASSLHGVSLKPFPDRTQAIIHAIMHKEGRAMTECSASLLRHIKKEIGFTESSQSSLLF